MENDDLIGRLEQLASEFGGPQDRYCVVYGEAAAALTAAEARIKMLSEALAFYSCDADNCDCVQGEEQSDRVACGFKAHQALKGASNDG